MRLKHSIFQIILEIAAFLTLLALWFFLFKSWDNLPDKIPTHYNGTGAVDQWGNKNAILFLPIIGAVLYVMISIITHFPSIWNVPVKVTEANRAFVYQNLKTLIILMKCEMMLCFAYIVYCNINLKALGIWFLPFFLIIIFGTVAYYTFKVLRRSR